MTGRRIYESSNGDSWTLQRSGDGLIVQHRANRASGAHTTDYELSEFIAGARRTPQHSALMDLIATLIERSYADRT